MRIKLSQFVSRTAHFLNVGLLVILNILAAISAHALVQTIACSGRDCVFYFGRDSQMLWWILVLTCGVLLTLPWLCRRWRLWSLGGLCLAMLSVNLHFYVYNWVEPAAERAYREARATEPPDQFHVGTFPSDKQDLADVAIVDGRPIVNAIMNGAIPGRSFGVQFLPGSSLMAKQVPGVTYLTLGYHQDYWVETLKRENPTLEYLNYLSGGFDGAYVIQEMIPVVSDPNAMRTEVSMSAENGFEVTATVTNSAASALTKARLSVAVDLGPFMIVDGDSYYAKNYDFTLGLHESRTFRFQVKERANAGSMALKDELSIYLSFEGYGIVNSAGNSKIEPLWGFSRLRLPVKTMPKDS